MGTEDTTYPASKFHTLQLCRVLWTNIEIAISKNDHRRENRHVIARARTVRVPDQRAGLTAPAMPSVKKHAPKKGKGGSHGGSKSPAKGAKRSEQKVILEAPNFEEAPLHGGRAHGRATGRTGNGKPARHANGRSRGGTQPVSPLRRTTGPPPAHPFC